MLLGLDLPAGELTSHHTLLINEESGALRAHILSAIHALLHPYTKVLL